MNGEKGLIYSTEVLTAIVGNEPELKGHLEEYVRWAMLAVAAQGYQYKSQPSHKQHILQKAEYALNKARIFIRMEEDAHFWKELLKLAERG